MKLAVNEMLQEDPCREEENSIYRKRSRSGATEDEKEEEQSLKTTTINGITFDTVPLSDGILSSSSSPSEKKKKDSLSSHHDGGKSGILGATFNFVNSIVGAGIVGIPFAIYRSGFVLGIILVLFIACLVDYGVRLLIQCGIETRKSTYEDLCYYVYGRKGFYIVSSFMFIFAYGSMVAYIIIIGDTVPHIAAQAQLTALQDRSVVIVLFATIFILPLCLLREMSSLAWSSFISVVADLTLVAILLHAAPQAARVEGITAETEESPFAFFRPTIFAGIGSMSFAFTCHHSSFFVHGSMKRPTAKRWNIVTHLSVGISCVACLTLGLSGYLNFYSHVESDILNNFDRHDSLINFARALLASTMVFTYPMEQYVARHSLNALLCNSKGEMSRTRHISLTLSLWTSSILIGLSFTELGLVLELTGAVAASTLGYILPGLIYFAVKHQKWSQVRAYWRRDSPDYVEKFCSRLSRSKDFILPTAMIGFGFVAMVVGTISAFYD